MQISKYEMHYPFFPSREQERWSISCVSEQSWKYGPVLELSVIKIKNHTTQEVENKQVQLSNFYLARV